MFALLCTPHSVPSGASVCGTAAVHWADHILVVMAMLWLRGSRVIVVKSEAKDQLQKQQAVLHGRPRPSVCPAVSSAPRHQHPPHLVPPLHTTGSITHATHTSNCAVLRIGCCTCHRTTPVRTCLHTPTRVLLTCCPHYTQTASSTHRTEQLPPLFCAGENN